MATISYKQELLPRFFQDFKVWFMAQVMKLMASELWNKYKHNTLTLILQTCDITHLC